MSRLRSACTPAVWLMLLVASIALPQDNPRSPMSAFSSGRETLNYAIEWRLIPAGTAKLVWSSLAPTPPGAQVNPAAVPGEIRLHLESAGLVSRLFRVNDDYTAALAQNFCAQNTFLSAHEGNRNRETRVVFDAQNRHATYLEKDLNRNSTVNREVEIPSCVHDVIGGLMVLRHLRLEPGKTVQIPLSDGKKFVQARVESQIREEVKTDLGTFKTIRYEVFVFDNVLFKRAGHLHVWLTDDEARIPVQLQVRFQITIGTITFRLEKLENK